MAALGTAVAWPLAVRAQQPARGMIGWLDAVGERDTSAFRLGLRDSGYAASRTVPILIWHDRRASLADDLIRTPVAMIVATGDVALAAKAATTSLPIVFYTERDPIKLGLVFPEADVGSLFFL
jgi:putative ABC transport system substrate-binding protein